MIYNKIRDEKTIKKTTLRLSLICGAKGFTLPYGILPYLRTLMNIDKLIKMVYCVCFDEY